MEAHDSVEVVHAWLMLFHGYESMSPVLRKLRALFGVRNTIEEFKVKQANRGMIQFDVLSRN